MAGTDTTSTTLSYAMWALATHVPVMRKLQVELDDAMDDPQRIPDMQVLMGLPYLNAVVKEGTCLSAMFACLALASSARLAR